MDQIIKEALNSNGLMIMTTMMSDDDVAGHCSSVTIGIYIHT